jgi:hypothetical protein
MITRRVPGRTAARTASRSVMSTYVVSSGPCRAANHLADAVIDVGGSDNVVARLQALNQRRHDRRPVENKRLLHRSRRAFFQTAAGGIVSRAAEAQRIIAVRAAFVSGETCMGGVTAPVARSMRRPARAAWVSILIWLL